MSSNKKDINTLHKQLKDFSKKRTLVAQKSKSQRRISFIVFQLLLYFSYTFGFFVFFSIRDKQFTISTFSNLLWAVSFFLSAMIYRNSSLQAPTDKKQLDEWIWKKGRRNFIYYFFAFLLFAINQGLPISIFGQYRLFAAMGYLSLAVYFLCILSILWKPELFTSGFIGGIGSSAQLFFIGALPSRLALLTVPDAKPLFLWLIIPSVLPYLGLLYILWRTKTLNFVQFAVLQVIHPDRLLTALRNRDQIIQDQYEALKIKNRVEKDVSLGIKTELIKLYATENKSWSQNLWWLGMAVALTAFLINTIGQLIVQDALYAPLIKPILCQIFTCK
jgi:hypothetical protein